MAKKKGGSAQKEPTFEEAMSKLESIVRELEEAELPLEKSLQIFEDGIRLSRFLSKKLNAAEEKVEILLRGEGGEKAPVPFNPDQDEPADEAGDEKGDTEQEKLF